MKKKKQELRQLANLMEANGYFGIADALRKAAAAKRLRYMRAENIAKDFPGKREREAIAAVFEWFGLNGISARPLKRSGQYATNILFHGKDRLADYTAIVMDGDKYDQAKKLLGVYGSRRPMTAIRSPSAASPTARGAKDGEGSPR